MSDSDRESVPTRVRPYYDALVGLTDPVCNAHLTDEYAQLCRRLAAALCRKRPSPVTSGRIESWACGIANAIGWVNFLTDSSQTPHMRTADLCAAFGVSAATGAAKSAEIRRLFKMRRMDPAWYRPSKLDDNFMAWTISVNGLIIDARDAPREIQEEAARRGLIPYLPPGPAIDQEPS
jgi:hypothetical protein